METVNFEIRWRGAGLRLSCISPFSASGYPSETIDMEKYSVSAIKQNRMEIVMIGMECITEQKKPLRRTSSVRLSPHRRGLSAVKLYVLVWSRRKDLNLQPAHYKCAALPIELRRHIIMGVCRCDIVKGNRCVWPHAYCIRPAKKGVV